VRRRVVWAVVLVLAAGWAVLATVSNSGQDPHAFRTAAHQAAQGALSAVRTAHLAGKAGLDGHLLPTYLTPVLDNAVEGVATAQQDLALATPPGPSEARTRDELAALLDDAARQTGLLVAAVDRDDNAAARAAVDALASVGDRLAEFVERHPT
jgi:hypothetical protein